MMTLSVYDLNIFNDTLSFEASSRWGAEWRLAGQNKLWRATELDQVVAWKIMDGVYTVLRM